MSNTTRHNLADKKMKYLRQLIMIVLQIDMPTNKNEIIKRNLFIDN